MKNNLIQTLFAFVLLAVVILSSGCMTTEMQKILSATLPPDYKGGAHITQKNPYTQIEVKFGNLHKLDNGQWSWDSFSYDGHSAFTQTTVTMEAPTVSPLVVSTK